MDVTVLSSNLFPYIQPANLSPASCTVGEPIPYIPCRWWRSYPSLSPLSSTSTLPPSCTLPLDRDDLHLSAAARGHPPVHIARSYTGWEPVFPPPLGCALDGSGCCLGFGSGSLSSTGQ
jgi:hypothetical protein